MRMLCEIDETVYCIFRNSNPLSPRVGIYTKLNHIYPPLPDED
jgi:hypothetical protein